MTTSSRLIVVVCTCWAGLALLSFSWAATSWAATPEPTAEQVKFFEEKVRPILAENCYKCHGEEKQKGSLRLDLREAVLAGGGNRAGGVSGQTGGRAVVAGVERQTFEMPATGNIN